MENYIKRCLCCVFLFNILFLCSNVFAQDKILLSGKVYNSSTKKPVDFGAILIKETKSKVYIEQDGSYSIYLPGAGEYTILIRVDGLSRFESKFNVTKNISRDFWLQPLSISGGVVKVTGEKYLQNVSRRNMSRDDLKVTPASFGDAINALTSLPGIDRTNGFFGPLVIRGMFPTNNRYFVDGMPINDPMHFGGLHSVINTNLMEEINLYSSAFPVRFGGAMAAVIDITTIDNVEKVGGYVDTGLISTNALLMTPLTTKVVDEQGVKKDVNDGYLIASGRFGYLGFAIPYIYEKVTGDKPTIVPEYYDYQVKFKKNIDSKNSVSMLFLGSSDYFKLYTEDDQFDDEADPLLNDLSFESNEMFHNLGLYYTYNDGIMKNRLMTYGSTTHTENYIDSRQLTSLTPDWLEDFNQDINANIIGIKNTFDFEWVKSHADLKVEVEYTYYNFEASGDTLTTSSADGGDELNNVEKIPLDITVTNHSVGGFVENRFTYEGLTFVPGLRSEYLNRGNQKTFDPRGMISYDFESDTSISFAAGKYSTFFQLNPYLFSFRPDLSAYNDDAIEQAYHTVAGIEQRFDLFTVGIEGYYNRFTKLAVEYPHYENGEYKEGDMTGEATVYGFELMIRKDKRKNTNGVFGWVSYTFCHSKYRSGITGNIFDEDGNDTGVRYDSSGDKWIDSDYDRRHSFKLVMGYEHGKHTISSKFQLYSSFPYTGIVGSEEDPNYPGRYTPVYDSSHKNEERLPVYHTLDLRYTYKTNYEWGYISWYIEVINVYANKEVENNWKYNQPYSSNNPELESNDGLSVIPNFGVEVKF